MSNPFESSKVETSQQESLKASLLAGKVSSEKFLEELYALDQSTPDKQQAIINTGVLESVEVSNKFIDTELESEFWSCLSLAHFHSGQFNAFHGLPGAEESFEAALAAAQKVREWGKDDEWVAYVAATAAYMKGDIEEVRKERKKVANARNGEIVDALIKDLDMYGTPDYIRAAKRLSKG